nr:MAG TPA: hypothetical protein [Caudoviricetes sp.]
MWGCAGTQYQTSRPACRRRHVAYCSIHVT